MYLYYFHVNLWHICNLFWLKKWYKDLVLFSPWRVEQLHRLFPVEQPSLPLPLWFPMQPFSLDLFMNSPRWFHDPLVFSCPYNPQLPLITAFCDNVPWQSPHFYFWRWLLGSLESLCRVPKNHPVGKLTGFVYLRCWAHWPVNLWKVQHNLGSHHFFTPPRPTSDIFSPCLHCYSGIWPPLSFQFALIWLGVRLSIFSYVYDSLVVFFMHCLIHTLSYFNWDAHHFRTDS